MQEDYLSNAQLLARCEAQLSPYQQDKLSDLLADSREGALTVETQEQLDSLMQLYRRGLIQKAEALKIAIKRGLVSFS